MILIIYLDLLCELAEHMSYPSGGDDQKVALVGLLDTFYKSFNHSGIAIDDSTLHTGLGIHAQDRFGFIKFYIRELSSIVDQRL